MNKPLPIRFRNRLLKLVREAQQIVNDIEWWNNNRLDSSPFDCETEKIVVHLGKQALVAYDAGNWDEHARLTSEMAALATEALED